MTHESVVITGIGVALPGCSSAIEMWHQIQSGESQLYPESFDGMVKPICAGKIQQLDLAELTSKFPFKYVEKYPWEIQLYLTALVRAMNDADLDAAHIPKEHAGIFDGTSRGSFGYWHDIFEKNVTHTPVQELMYGTPGQAGSIAASLLSIYGNVLTFSTSCTSGAVAIGHAFEQIQSGKLKLAFAGGHETPLNTKVLDIYVQAGLASDDASADSKLTPYQNSCHTMLAEGAATLVLESEDHAKSRDVRIFAKVIAHKQVNSGFHPTNIDASGETACKNIRQVMEEANIKASEVKAIVGHGNGIPKSDQSEKLYIEYLKRQGMGDIPLIALKPAYGHSLGASSATNIAFAATALQQQLRFNSSSRHYYYFSNSRANSNRPTSDRNIILSVSYGIGGHYHVMALEDYAMAD